MENKKSDVQVKITNDKNGIKATKEEIIQTLRSVSPGTNLRNALDGMVQAQKGGLIVVDNPGSQKIIDGGFKINSRFTPQRAVELAKMDGAIVLTHDMKRITHANVTLYPDTRIKTHETGTRHKAAERTAKMLDTLTIAISERKNKVTVYYKNWKYQLRDLAEILTRANETLHLLEKQRELFDEGILQLNIHEIYDDINLGQACKVIQKGNAMVKILKSQEKTLIELGNEGTPLKLRIKELMKGVEKQTNLVIKDYTRLNLKKSKNILESLNYEELLDPENIITALAQSETQKVDSIKGWRLLGQTSLSEREIAEILQELKNLKEILNSPEEKIKELIDEKAKSFIKEIEKIKNQ